MFFLNDHLQNIYLHVNTLLWICASYTINPTNGISNITVQPVVKVLDF